ncbi:MAG: InlB B-repeat-containing protein [Ruminococcus sp.]|nr:InlB B-repeat-containing protein [Ruminococcus sp.]
MNENKLNTAAWRVSFKVISLLLAVAMFFTSGSTVTALDTLQAMRSLIEQTYTLTPEEGVTITLEGLMPANGSAEAESAQVEEEGVIHAYDISIYYADGTTFEPSEASPITVSFMSDAIADAIEDDAVLEVEHIADSGKTESIELISAEDDQATFEAESFSVYVIKTHDENNENLNPRRTYHFLSPKFSQTEIDGVTHYQAPAYEFPNKLQEMVTTQTIRSGESLQEIVLPENDNSGLFYGWFVVQYSGRTEDVTTTENDVEVTRTNYIYDWGNGTPEHVEFNEPITFSDTDDSDIWLAPLFGRYRFLTFHQDVKGSANENVIVSRKLIALGDDRKCTLSISDVRAPSTNPNRIIFWGWEFTHTEGDSLKGQTETIQTVSVDDSEIPSTITIEDKRVINGIQPTDEEQRHMIYDIWPVFKEARWVYFDNGGNGAAYTPPQFIMLDEPPTSFGNVPVRTGWNFKGWYYKKDGKSIQITDSNANILSGVNVDLETGVSISGGKLVMTTAAEEQTFYAEWEKASTADYHVIVWKQKVTDDKDASDANKTYDFEGYYTLSGSTDQDATATSAFINGHYTSFTTDSTKASDFIGFHYNASLTTVTDDGYGSNGNKINSNGSTVVNVYYDRDLMTVTYHYQTSQLPSGTMITDSGYTYIATTSNTGELYGYINGEYIPLSVDASVETDYFFPYRYSSTTSTSTSNTYYGVVGDTYVPLTQVGIYTWTKRTGNNMMYTPSTSTNEGNYYLITNGSFTSTYLYYYDGTWYRTRSGWWNYTYSDPYYGTRYTRGRNNTSGTYTGTRYILGDDALEETNSTSTSSTQYGVENGFVYTLSRSTNPSGYYFTYNDTEYTGTRYTRTNSNTAYTGTLYKKSGSSFVAAADDSGTVYGIDSNGVYAELSKSNTYTYTWKRADTGAEYNGTRYLRFQTTNDSTFTYQVVWTGLYGQPYSMYGYTFPSEYMWKEQTNGGSTQTLLSGFTNLNSAHNASNTDYHLYCQGDANTGTLYHLRQKLDGTYSTDEAYSDIAHVSTGNVTFTFTNKFDGYEVCGYSTTLLSSGSGTGFNAVSPGEEASLSPSSTTIYYVYHKRLSSLEFVYNDNYTGGGMHTLYDLSFGQPLNAYADAYTPAPRANYNFTGWYEDSSCTRKFDFNTTMPAANKMVYAGWSKIRFRVQVDPNGGEFPLGGNFSTYFKVDYDEPVTEYGTTERTYYEDSSGDYVYFCADYNIIKEFPDVDLDGAYRKAFYIKKSEIENTYNMVFTVGGAEYSYISVMSFDQFRACINMNKTYSPTAGTTESFRLVSWHKVRADGTTEVTPFNFKSQLTEDTKIQARWVQVGGYALTYNPTMTSTGITGDMARVNDPLESGRKYADKAPVVILQEPSNLSTTGAGGHEIDASEWVFRGWRVVHYSTREPLEPGVFYDPGDTMILDAANADSQGVIHMEAYYERRANTTRRVDVASVTLHANSETASVNEQGLANDKYEYADILNKQLKLERRNNNFKVELANYIKNFTNSDGSLLLGWNTTPDADTYIPEYYADAVIGVNKENLPNNLYAVWEPMIYLTLNNTTSQAISFNLKFKNYDGTVYAGYANTMTGELERTPFSSETFVTKNSSGDFNVTLPAGKKIQLVVPAGVLADGAGTYTVSGTYSRDNTKNLFIYNSGSATSVSIEGRGNTWELNGTTTSDSPISYSTEGSLVKGPQGRLVRFVESNQETELDLKSRYYDVDAGEWKDGTSTTGAKADAHFNLASGYSETQSADGYTTKVNLINNNNTVTFGLKVNSYDTENYKFIGWYYTPTAAPNAYSVDRHASDFGEANISGLAVPPERTVYYALFVPYIKGSLTIQHNERADSAGHCDDNAGLGLKIQYYTDADATLQDITSASGNSSNPATCTLSDTIIDEKNTTGHLKVTVRARPETGSTYKATYRNLEEVRKDGLGQDSEGYTYAVFDAPVSKRFVASDTVKGLMELRTVSYSSVFSRNYTISYQYTARDGSTQTYTKKGPTDTFDDFDEYVIEQTPYERTLAGDTVWDIENITQTIDDNGMNATLTEIANFRSKCTVTIMEAGGYTPTERVEYGETFSDEQAEKHIAPSEKDGKLFDYWEIVNTKTGEHIANCYSEKFTFAVWNDYTITPHYSATPASLADEEAHITLDYIDTSRNQWGEEVIDDKDASNRTKVSDKLVVDMDISFIDGDHKILDAVDEVGNNQYQLGVMFEVVDTTEDGTFDKTAYAAGEEGMASRAQTLINANTKPSGTAKISDVNCYFSKISITEDTVSSFNRSEFARSFNTSGVKNKVLRMYAYMQTPKGNVIVSAPKYITMYDYAKSNLAIDYAKRSAKQSSD